MSEEMKPREFWLDTYNNVLAGCAPAKPDQNIIHVIEYSAYEALKKECDVLQLEKTYYYEGLELHFNSKIDKLAEQNKIMREALKFYAKGFGGHPLEGLKAREALAKCGSTEPEKS